MISRRGVLGLLAATGALATTSVALAKQEHHKNGLGLLGAKLKQNGKHEIDKIHKATVSAEVSNGKVIAMSATDPQKGSLPFRKVKSRRKLAEFGRSGIVPAAAGDRIELAQDAIIYYAWCFDDGIDFYCYWYPADVVIVDAGWIEYGPV